MTHERVILLLTCCLCLLAGAAAGEVPCDRDGDGTLTSAELATAILDSLDGRCMGGAADAPSLVDLQDAAFVYTHWDGRALTITDSSGRTTTVSRPLRRIVIFSSYAPDLMRLIGIEPDRVVGVGTGVLRDPIFYPEYQGKPDVGVTNSPKYEQMALLCPDAIFLDPCRRGDDEVENKLASIDPGIHFFRFYCYLPETYADEVQRLGILFGKKEEAARFLAFRGDVLDTVAGVVEKIPAEDRVSVYWEFSNDYQCVQKGSTYDEMIELAGGRNILADEPPLGGGNSANPEEVITGNPDVIIKSRGGGYGDNDARLSFETIHLSIMNRPAWGQITAVRNGRVYIIHNNLIGASQKFIGIAYLAKWFHPDHFPDLDPDAIHQQYLSEFQRLDYDLDKHAAFVYPA